MAPEVRFDLLAPFAPMRRFRRPNSMGATSSPKEKTFRISMRSIVPSIGTRVRRPADPARLHRDRGFCPASSF